jgi:hypothetical protein
LTRFGLMQTQRNEAQRIAVIAIASFLFLGAAVVIIWRRKTVPPQPVPLSTNELKVGAKLFNSTENTNHVFTVIEVDRAYDFPNGDIRPGVRIRSEVIGRSTWVPRENLDKFHVVQ